MTGEMMIPLISRWAHVLTAVVVVGGAIFLRFVLMPAASSVLNDEEHGRLRTAVLRRWKMFVHGSIALLLVSGFYNYLAVTRFNHEEQPLYHALFGMKFSLAVLVFALGIALTSRGELFAAVRENSRIWLAVLVAMAIVVVLMGGVLHNLPVTSG